ncbi:MAG TPA: TIGR03557 family F420-dependent LLM class oxidoreductase [Chloroflexota bacterium]|nr:TIGR03557 family F420-dependent LLM class oxidoreductase [Chloroflexota bacterium]
MGHWPSSAPTSSPADHHHPWVDAQGHSPFVWSVIGAIAHATSTLQLETGVTCPIIRIHPAIMAQAAATAACMLSGRSFFGIGTGERLNEHILGDGWPEPTVRLAMIEEALELMRKLWAGGARGEYVSHYGGYHTVENARIYDVPAAGVPVMLAAKGPLSTELAIPEQFQQAAEMVNEEDVAKEVVCGPDPVRHIEKIQEYVDAGYDHVYVHQVGPDQEGMLRFYEREILPHFANAANARRKPAGRAGRAATAFLPTTPLSPAPGLPKSRSPPPCAATSRTDSSTSSTSGACARPAPTRLRPSSPISSASSAKPSAAPSAALASRTFGPRATCRPAHLAAPRRLAGEQYEWPMT